MRVRGGEGRGGNIEQFWLPPKWGDVEGREGELFSILLNRQNYSQYILEFQYYPHYNFDY
jgi:hypothetical protein